MTRRSILASIAVATLLSTSALGQTLSWSTSPNRLEPLMPAGIQMNGTAVVTVEGKSYAYIIGGNRSTDEGGDTTEIHYAPVDGAKIGPWALATARLKHGGTTYHTRSTVGFRGRLYVVGGRLNQEGDFSTPYNGIRVFEPVGGGDIPQENVTYYTGDGDGEDIPDVEPRLDILEMAAVVNGSGVHPGDGIVYILGGGLGDDATNVVRSIRIDGASGRIVGAGPGGELAPALTELAPLPVDIAFHQAVIHDGYIYVAGNNPPSATVYYAAIQRDDTLSEWKSAGAPLPEVRLDAAAASFGGHFYVIGGTAGTNADTRNTVFRAVFREGGDIAGWLVDAPVPVEPGFRRVGATVTSDAIFIIGGRIASDRFSPDVQVGVKVESP